MSSGRTGDPARGFDPGNSFTEESLPAPDPSELPSWLQNFAEMAADAPPAPPVATVPATPAQPAGAVPISSAHTSARHGSVGNGDDDAVIPGWLDSSAAGSNTPNRGAMTDTSPIGGADFFSEDDLPEWLRALSTSPSPEGPAVTGSPPAASSAATTSTSQRGADTVTFSTPPTATVTVPAVTRIWITEHDVPEPTPGASIFAEIAQVVDLRPDVPVSEAPANVGPQPARSSAAAPVTAVEKTPRTERSWGWTFRLAVLMIIILAVIGLVYLNLAG